MPRLTDPGQLQEAEAAFDAVFAGASYTTPFRDDVVGRLLIYPIDYTVLTERQFNALATVAGRYGITHAYLAAYSGESKGWGGTRDHRVINLGSYGGYRAPSGSANLEHFLFAPNGAWGVATSDGEYAVLGGQPQIVTEVGRLLRESPSEMVSQFIADERQLASAGAAVSWVPLLLDHVLGRGGAQLWSADKTS